MSHRNVDDGEAAETLEMAVTLVLSPGMELAGNLVDMSRGGATVAFAASSGTTLSPDTEVEFVLSSYRLSCPFRALGKVVEWWDDEHAAWCRLDFLDPDHLEKSLPRDLRETLTRRRYQRLKLAPVIEVEIAKKDGSERVTGDLLDLSAGGLKLILRSPLASARNVEAWQDVRLTLQLPEAEAPFEVAASVRTRFGLRLGLEFDADETRGFEEIQGQVRQFMMERQRRVLEVPRS